MAISVLVLLGPSARAQLPRVIEGPEKSALPPVKMPSDEAVQTITFTRPTAVVPPASAILSQGAQLPGRGDKTGDAAVDFTISVELPGPDRLFRRDSENQLFDRIREESTRPGGTRVIFPERLQVAKEPYTGRHFPQTSATVEAMYVAHPRLLFEHKNFDRQGWELGYLQPGITAGRFFYDMVLLPYHCGTEPWRHWDASLGKCLPGDHTPLYCYSERFSLTGLTLQAGAVAGGILIFP